MSDNTAFIIICLLIIAAIVVVSLWKGSDEE